METKKKVVTYEELDKHNAEGNSWILIKGRVYDVSDYVTFHPGGVDAIMQHAG